MKYFFVGLILLLVLPLSVSAATCNTAELADLYVRYNVSALKAARDQASAQLNALDLQYAKDIAAPGGLGMTDVGRKARNAELTRIYSLKRTEIGLDLDDAQDKYEQARTTADRACITYAQDKIEREQQEAKDKAEREQYLAEMRAKNAANQAEIARSNAALYANQPTEPSKPVPTPKPAATPKVVVPSDVTVGRFKPDDISGETGVFIGTSSNPTTTEPIVQEQVEVQEPIAVETVPTPEPVKENVVFKVLRSISNLFKKLW